MSCEQRYGPIAAAGEPRTGTETRHGGLNIYGLQIVIEVRLFSIQSVGV
jgi:hypothetical protein